MRVVISPHRSAERSGALERRLLAEGTGDALLLYINPPTVVVGRYQTVAAEADEQWCAAHQVPIVRRLSGGGAVYHDEGNINYAFVVDRAAGAALDRDFATPIIAALRALGVPVALGQRKELRCMGYKVSGTAAHVAHSRQLLHGTLLYRTNLAALACALRGNPALRGRGIASVPDKVANIAELLHLPQPTEDFLRQLAEALRQYYRGAADAAQRATF